MHVYVRFVFPILTSTIDFTPPSTPPPPCRCHHDMDSTVWAELWGRVGLCSHSTHHSGPKLYPQQHLCYPTELYCNIQIAQIN